MKGNVLVGGLMMATAVYGLSFAYFWPEKLKLSPRCPLWLFRLGMVLVILCAVVVIVAPLIFHDTGH
jgi:hypothetical protein